MIVEYRWENLREALVTSEPGVLDGRAVSQALLSELTAVSQALVEQGVSPHLAVVQVGDDPASSIYIRHKVKACEKIGVLSSHHQLLASITQAELHAQLDALNEDPCVHGILLQLPLPDGLDSDAAMRRMDPNKDVDGFHPYNLGGLMAGRADLEPCTPTGVITLLHACGVGCRGKESVVVGRSVIVGRPMALMLARADSTVTLCHRYTKDLEEAVRRAEILVVATGVPGLIPGEWIRPEAVVVDVGISRVEGRLRGDVDFEEARTRASWITPVPGGVGPMTVATLMENTLKAACLQHRMAYRGGRLVALD